VRGSRATAALLALVTVLAAVLRIAGLDASPPGLNQDEALSAWNGWCLLHTGRALSGELWPIFHCRNIGDHPTMLFFYLLMPFQALGGLNVWTTRLPVAIAGVLATPLLYWIGARLFRPAVGLLAAALFAVAPWATFVGRLGVGAGLSPLQALLPVAALLMAGLPIADRMGATIRPAWAFAAGLAAGLAGYGFHSLRLYMPLLLAALLLVAPSRLVVVARAPRGRKALLALAAGFALTFGPLAWRSLVDPAMIQRWQMTRLWQPTDPIPVRVGLVARRWIEHFGPGFLFVHGDTFPPFQPPGQGELGWYVLPGLLAGAWASIAAARRSVSARTLLALVALYPAGDVVSRYDGPHLLRSALGIGSLLLLAALGTAELVRALVRRRRALGVAFAALFAIGGVAQEVRYELRFFRDYPNRAQNQIDYQVALLDAARWLKPRLARTDAVFCTTAGMNEPFSVLLVGLGYDAAQWQRDVKDRREDEFDRYVRVGKLYFLYGQDARPAVEALQNNGRDDRVLFLVRPNELGLGRPIKRFYLPDGREALWACEYVI